MTLRPTKQEEKKQLKDQTFLYATIKIYQTRERFKIGDRHHQYKDKMYSVEIDDGNYKIGFCQPTLKKLFKSIKEEMCL